MASALGGVSDLSIPIAMVGDDRAAMILSLAVRFVRLPPGLWFGIVVPGSMSREDRKEVLSRSVLVLVT